MIIILVTVLLFILFFFIKKHVGPAHLAVIAGVSIYESIGKDFASNIAPNLNSVPKDLIEIIIFLLLVLALPLLLYFRSSRGGVYGFLRIIEALSFSALLASMCAWCITYFVPMDELSKTILSTIEPIKGIIAIVGIAFAYFDILFYRSDR